MNNKPCSSSSTSSSLSLPPSPICHTFCMKLLKIVYGSSHFTHRLFYNTFQSGKVLVKQNKIIRNTFLGIPILSHENVLVASDSACWLQMKLHFFLFASPVPSSVSHYFLDFHLFFLLPNYSLFFFALRAFHLSLLVTHNSLLIFKCSLLTSHISLLT